MLHMRFTNAFEPVVSYQLGNSTEPRPHIGGQSFQFISNAAVE